MLTDVWPLFGLSVTTGRLRLRLPREEEIAALAALAARGVHRDGERPFLTPWTEGSPEDRARAVLRGHWAGLASWSAAAWELGMGVFAGGTPIGIVALRARDFPVVREVSTWSWLGLEHQGHGYGTEARAGVLALAFDHLGASAARSEVFPDNHASQAVSRKLGYEPDGISVDARDGEALVSDRLRLPRARWRGAPAEVTGLSACHRLFG